MTHKEILEKLKQRETTSVKIKSKDLIPFLKFLRSDGQEIPLL